jgi:hypothetical protein
MSHKWTFETAFAFWHHHHQADPETVWDRFVSAEAFILDHAPTSAVEADLVLEVMIAQGPDGRGDGRDRRALQRLRAFVGNLRTAEAAAA